MASPFFIRRSVVLLDPPAPAQNLPRAAVNTDRGPDQKDGRAATSKPDEDPRSIARELVAFFDLVSWAIALTA